MCNPSLNAIENLRFSNIPANRLADYAYALEACRQLTSSVAGDWYHKVDRLCELKLGELRDEINHRLGKGGDPAVFTYAMDVLEHQSDIYSGRVLNKFPSQSELTHLSASELVRLHSLDKCWYESRVKNGLEPVTRVYQWQIVHELMRRREEAALSQILQLIEHMEADGYALSLGCPYKIGDRPESFNPSEYSDDEALIRHIQQIKHNGTYLAREALIEIADYIQVNIVDSGKTAEHLQLVNAILSTDMPSFNYPKIGREFEKATKSLAASKVLTEMELAPAYLTLWTRTLKPVYLSRFEKATRRCYLSLAKGKTYPGLGIDINDSKSLNKAIKFLEDNRKTLWILNERYDIDKVVEKYRTA